MDITNDDEYRFLQTLENIIHGWCATHKNPFKRVEFSLIAYRRDSGTVKVDGAHWCGENYQQYEAKPE